ncbi:MAG: methylamine dehydrogenase (amicyanin) small subunit [Proteobacteria bacterium]|nr:methylamine dehydrogenase (amicyanin) small subunit [Pseudomonadota bacterium]
MKLNDFDRFGERALRRVAARSSRRGLLAKLGTLLVAAPLFPLLPVSRAAANGPAEPPTAPTPRSDFGAQAQADDPKACNYWRYCGTDGFLCSCCGGGVHTCPPGTEASPTMWIGSCLNPGDQRTYLIAYRDCCGVGACGDCYCNNTEGETPVYRPTGNNNIIWCFGTSSMEYHCSMAVLIGLQE